MMVLLALGALSLWAVLATIAAIANDGYRAIPDDPDYDSRTPTRGTRVGTGSQAKAGNGPRRYRPRA